MMKSTRCAAVLAASAVLILAGCVTGVDSETKKALQTTLESVEELTELWRERLDAESDKAEVTQQPTGNGQTVDPPTAAAGSYQDEALKLLGPADSVIHLGATCAKGQSCFDFQFKTVPARAGMPLSALEIQASFEYQPAESRGGVSLAQYRRRYDGDTSVSVHHGYGGWLEHSFFHVWSRSITVGGLTVERVGYADAHSVGDAAGTNPTPVAGSATWAGVMAGVDISDSPRLGSVVSGNAAVRIANLTAPLVDVSFTNIRDEGSGAARADMRWSGLAVTGGVFDDELLRGQFYGSNHEEVGGVFRRDDIAGAFGAVRE